MENKYGFIRYEYLHDDDFNIVDVFNEEHSISNGDILYCIDGVMYYVDQYDDKLVKLIFDMKKFFDDDTYLMFDQLP